MPMNLPPVEVHVDRSAHPTLRVTVRMYWTRGAFLDVPLLLLEEPRRWKRGQKRTARDRRRARAAALDDARAPLADMRGWPP